MLPFTTLTPRSASSVSISFISLPQSACQLDLEDPTGIRHEPSDNLTD